jgi:hypothetical protein
MLVMPVMPVMPTKVGIHDLLFARSKVVDADLRRHDEDGGNGRDDGDGSQSLCLRALVVNLLATNRQATP